MVLFADLLRLPCGDMSPRGISTLFAFHFFLRPIYVFDFLFFKIYIYIYIYINLTLKLLVILRIASELYQRLDYHPQTTDTFKKMPILTKYTHNIRATCQNGC
jgi:hypothetical protein